MKKLIIFILLLSLSAYAKDVPLEWDHACDVTGFRVYRSQGSSDWPELVGTVQCPAKTFTDVDVPHGDLRWIVTAYENDKESNASNEVELAYYYALTKFDYDASGRILYRGQHQAINASENDTNWIVTKYYYDANGSLIEMRVRTTSWTDRATGW